MVGGGAVLSWYYRTPQLLAKQATVKCICSMTCRARLKTSYVITGEFEVYSGVMVHTAEVIGCLVLCMLIKLFGGNLWHLEHAEHVTLASHDLQIVSGETCGTVH